MRKEYCPNHHYYDADRYASCPFCAKTGMETAPVVKPDPVTEPISGSWKNKQGKTKDDADLKTGKSKWPWKKEPPATEIGAGNEPISKTVPPETESGSTPISGNGNQVVPEPVIGQGNEPYTPPTQVPPVYVPPQTPPITPAPQPQPQPQPQPVSGNSQLATGMPYQGGSSLQSDLGKVNKGNEPKTMSYWGNNFTDEPPVGWFACIGGPCVGSTYEIYSGKNGIGRKMAAENKIMIQQDAKISGIKHTTVMYDPKGRKFYLLPGEGNGMVYRNEEIVLNIMELSAHDVLQIGDTSLMLIPLCGPDFTWEDWMEKSDE